MWRLASSFEMLIVLFSIACPAPGTVSVDCRISMAPSSDQLYRTRICRSVRARFQSVDIALDHMHLCSVC